MMKYQKCDLCPCCIGVKGKKATLLLYRVCTMCYTFSMPKRMKNMVTAHEVVAEPAKTPKMTKKPAVGNQGTVKKPRAAPRKRKIEEGSEETPVIVKKRKPRAPKSEGSSSSSAKTSPENSVEEKPPKKPRAKQGTRAKGKASLQEQQ